jgi:hypothetical protein
MNNNVTSKTNLSPLTNKNNYESNEPVPHTPEFINYKHWPFTHKWNKEEHKNDSEKYTNEPKSTIDYEFRQKHNQIFDQYQKCLSDTKCETECDKYLDKAIWFESKYKDSLY